MLKTLFYRVGLIVFCAFVPASALVPGARLYATSSDISVNVCYLPLSPVIVSPSDGSKTKKSSITLNGHASSDAVVYIYRNGAEQGFVTANRGGLFSVSISLIVGANTFIASERNVCGDSSESIPVTVTREQTTLKPHSQQATTSFTPSGQEPTPTLSPGLEPLSEPVILEPKDGMATVYSEVWLHGRSDAFVLVRIVRNGHVMAEITSDEMGEFAANIPLENGVNFLTVEAVRNTELTRSKTIKVTYEQAGTLSSAKTKKPLLAALGLAILILAATVYILVRRKLASGFDQGNSVSAPHEFNGPPW